MDLHNLYSIYIKNPSVSTDTRTLKAGDIFFALDGPNFSGSQFTQLALDKGAALVVCKDEPHLPQSERIFIVKDVLQCLQQLANHHRKNLTIPVLGITGSNGKTTNKELISAVLGKKYKVHATKGNLNNHIGVPLTILSTPPDTDILVLEMGANHANEIAQLCEIGEPSFGFITNIGKAHLGEFGSEEIILHTKAALYLSVMNSGGTIFYNTENYSLQSFLEGYEKIVYFDSETKPFSNIIVQDDLPLSFTCRYDAKDYSIATNLFGRYNITNIIASCVVGLYFGVLPEDALCAIHDYIPSNMRSQMICFKGKQIILDAYNANPASMRIALEALKSIDRSKKLTLVLGEMKELGHYSDEEHQNLVDFIANSFQADIILVGGAYLNIIKPLHVQLYLNTEELLTNGGIESMSGEVIFLKGSRTNKLESLLSL